MAKNYAIEGEKRERTGKGVARALRRENKIPGVIYGDGKPPVTITLSAKEINLEYRKGYMFTSLCDLKVDDEKHRVLARDIQVHPVTENVLHIDFLRVTPKTRIQVSVPVQVINEEESPGLRDKGILSYVRYEVELICRATNIPDYVEIDLSQCEIGDVVKISDITLPEGATPAIEDRDFSILMISAPRRIEVEEEEEAAEGEVGEAAEGEEGAATEGEDKKTGEE